MNFNRRIKQIILEAGGYFGQAGGTPQDAVRRITSNFQRINQNAKMLKVHPDRASLDNDNLKAVTEIVKDLETHGDKLVDKSGKPMDKVGMIMSAFDITNHDTHDYKTITNETKSTNWKAVDNGFFPRSWFNLYSKYLKHKAVGRSTYSQDQRKIDHNEVFYFGDDGKPYVTRIAFDPSGDVDGVIFLRGNRFMNTMVDQIINPKTKKPVKPMRFDPKSGKPKGTIPLNANIERVFKQPSINKVELKKILKSNAAESAFKKRMKNEPDIAEWYDTKWSKIEVK
jgi:hypothetical protein